MVKYVEAAVEIVKYVEAAEAVVKYPNDVTYDCVAIGSELMYALVPMYNVFDTANPPANVPEPPEVDEVASVVPDAVNDAAETEVPAVSG